MPRKPNNTSDHYHDPFPSALRELMRLNKKNQTEIAEVLGLKNRQSVTGYVDGSTQPTPDKIILIAEYFNVSADYLLGLSDVKSPDMDIQAVCKFTGLKEETIKDLRGMHSFCGGKPSKLQATDVIDCLVSDYSFTDDLLSNLQDALNCSVPSDTTPEIEAAVAFCLQSGRALLTKFEARDLFVDNAAAVVRAIFMDMIEKLAQEEAADHEQE